MTRSMYLKKFQKIPLSVYSRHIFFFKMVRILVRNLCFVSLLSFYRFLFIFFKKNQISLKIILFQIIPLKFVDKKKTSTVIIIMFWSVIIHRKHRWNWVGSLWKLHSIQSIVFNKNGFTFKKNQ